MSGPAARSRTRAEPQYDVARLASELGQEIAGRVSSEPAIRALYAVDASNYRVVPDLVVQPRAVDELATAVAIATAHGAPVVLRGSGTSMAGNAIGGVVIDTSRHLNRILDLDPVAHTARVQPGVVLSDLNRAAAAHGLFFGVDPSSATRATIGGMIGNNACGAHSVAFGTTADNVVSLGVALADGTRMELPGSAPLDLQAELRARPGGEGELHRALQGLVADNTVLIERRFAPLRRRISGYAMDRLLPGADYQVARFLAGTEGTLATTLEAQVRLVEIPKAKVLLVLGFADPVAAADAVPVILPFDPLTMESINAELVERLPQQVRAEATKAGLPEGRLWLLVDVQGDTVERARDRCREVVAAMGDAGALFTSSVVVAPGAQAVLWRCRRDGTGLATRRADGAEAWAGWEDAAVPPSRLGEYLTRLDGLLARHGFTGASYGHFGEGCMHMRIDFDLLSEPGVQGYRAFVDEAADLVVSLGGSVSGEHGDGRARSELLAKMYGADGRDLFERVKQLWDPSASLNPGVIVRPEALDIGMRHLGAAKDRELLTIFSYPEDAESFAQAQRRCVGVGKCLQSTGGVMCPSFRATREESHSTRGRAHLLWEMLEGEVITDGWRSEEVREALDLCLSCKGCLSDCPVNVDMATYKAEFQYQHYRRRARPRSHYSMGWLPLWALLAGRAPRLVNKIGKSRWNGALKRWAGVAPQRDLPEFAERTLVHQMAGRRRPAAPSRGRVVLWPDTFTNRLAPDVGLAAVRVLEAAGFEVIVPSQPVCCGLTWISTGQLGIAKKALRRTLRTLQPFLDQGIPVVGLEPSCTAVFRHDAPRLLSGEPLAIALKDAVRTLPELLAEFAPEWEIPAVGGRAVVQRHCHQYAVMGFEDDAALLETAGVDATVLDSGCCGLAGNFGFEAEHYEVSMAVGEAGVLPQVRGADPGSAIVADGFSCRTQIAHGTGRGALHLAEVLAATLDKQTDL